MLENDTNGNASAADNKKTIKNCLIGCMIVLVEECVEFFRKIIFEIQENILIIEALS